MSVRKKLLSRSFFLNFVYNIIHWIYQIFFILIDKSHYYLLKKVLGKFFHHLLVRVLKFRLLYDLQIWTKSKWHFWDQTWSWDYFLPLQTPRRGLLGGTTGSLKKIKIFFRKIFYHNINGDDIIFKSNECCGHTETNSGRWF